MAQEGVEETHQKLKEIREVSKEALKVIKKVSKDVSKAEGENSTKKMMDTTEDAASIEQQVQAALAHDLAPVFKDYETAPQKPSGDLEPISLSGETSLHK